MELSDRELWAVIHGFILGFGLAFAFALGLAGMSSLRPDTATSAVRQLVIGTTSMAAITWLTVITGTWVIYPWYREEVDESARSRLLANPATEDWHQFGMEWKEHVAWIAPMLATAAAVVVLYYRQDMIRNKYARLLAVGLFVTAFVVVAIAGVLGALISRQASV